MIQTQQTIQQFYDQALSMLAAPASDCAPVPCLFPEKEIPGVFVYFGPAEALKQMRAQLPAATFLLAVYDEAPPQDISGRSLAVHICDGAPEKAALLVSLSPKKSVRAICDDQARSRFPDEWRVVTSSLETAIQNAASEERRGLIRLRAACCNLKQMVRGPQIGPATVPADSPVVLCGAGPSLARELDALRALQGSVVIAAVGHAVRTLDAAGIVPDIVVEGDALAGRNWPEGLAPNSLLIATAECAPDVTARFENILWCMGSSVLFNGWARDHQIPLFEVALNKTVSVHAIDYLIRTGFRKIALIGQDYCVGSDGQVYAESSPRNRADQLFELPGAEGGMTVFADDMLKSLWGAFNSHLDAVHSFFPDLEVVNASGGAALNHTSVDLLASWGQSVGASKPDLLWTVEPASPNASSLDHLLSEFHAEREAIGAILLNCKTLRNELQRYPIRVNLLKRRQASVETAIAAEAAARESAESAAWLHTLLHISDEVMKDTPGLMSEEADPEKQLLYLTRRYRFADYLCEDLMASVQKGGAAHRFRAFAEENLTALERANPTLADRLRHGMEADEPSEFDIHWFNQILPFVKRRQGEQWCALSAFTSFFSEAREQIRAFVEANHFDPRRDALTVVAPGNWVYVREWVRLFPEVELSVIELWPDLLAQLIQGGCFLNLLPASACVVTSWADPLYVRRRAEWTRRGLRELRFVAPHVASMPDVQTLIRNMELLP